MKKKKFVLTAAALACLLTAGGGAVIWSNSSAASSAESATESSAYDLVPVTRGDLTETHTFSGTLGFGSPVAVPAAPGTLTWLPQAGDVIVRDQPLYAVDEHPVRAFHGTSPMWRELRQGVQGTDVTQLTQNLHDLGYNVDVDDRFGLRTRAAVESWQRDRGLTVTGTLTSRDIVFVTGDVRVASVSGVLGQPAAGPPLSVTSTTRVVSANVAERDAEKLAVGAEVGVIINGLGDQHPGTVVDATPATRDDGSSTVDVIIAFDAGTTALPAAASAQLRAYGRTETDVLTVPVSALIAGNQPGDYVVEMMSDDGSAKRVPVKVGFVADGRAVITGSVKEGSEVVVPR